MTASVLQVGLPQAQTAISIQFTYLEVDFCFLPLGVDLHVVKVMEVKFGVE